MSIEMVVCCDKCGTEVARTDTSWALEMRTGRERRRRPIDLCKECLRWLEEWLKPDPAVPSPWEG